jgi:predicted ATPase/DNA-binding SARP family transcriptional activator/DNA-binding CsgD family transcriptional regulator
MDPSGFEGEARKAVRVWLLGGFRVSVGSRNIPQDAWRLRKAAALVKLLALAPGHHMHREQIMALLWPDSGRRAASNSLRSTLHAARKVLDPAVGSLYLTSEGESLVLCPGDNLLTDVEGFEEAAGTARHTRDPAAYRVAIEMYTGELLPEDRFEEWAEERREGLRNSWLSLHVELARVYEGRGEYERGIEALNMLVAEEHTNQEAHTGLMRLHALAGRQAEALAQYERFEKVLSRELGVEPNASSRALMGEILAGRFPPPKKSAGPPTGEDIDTPRHNLPVSRTSFVGREREMVEIKRTLAMTRLLTLTGTGGCGKTRLALEVAEDLVGAYPDGVWLVELAPLSEGELVPQAMAEVLGVPEQPDRPLTATLAAALRTTKMLVVLDNCEHLLGTCAQLVDVLLASCPGVRVLASSREPLNVAGEVVWSVPPLSVPGADRPPTLEGLGLYESARLFVERALRRPGSLVMTVGAAQAVAEICQQLDGMPLAIELAAARVGTLAVGQIADRLGDSLKLLTSGERTAAARQRTLRGTLDWSYDLLSEWEKRLLWQLSAFAGGWTLEAAEVVGAGAEEDDVLNLLSRLVDKSLVVAEVARDGPVRYRMLETVRQYAHERLEKSGEAEVVHRRHAGFFLALAEEAEPQLKGAQQEAWLERLDEDHDNFRAALAWDLAHGEAELALRLSAGLGEFWHMRGYLSEGRRWLEAALARGDAPSVARVRTLAKASWIAWEQLDLERGTALGEEGLGLARELGDEEGIATMLMNLGVTAMIQGQAERATTLLEESVPLCRVLGDKWVLARSLLCAGLVAMIQRDYGRARRLDEESLTIAREAGDSYGSIFVLNHLALVALLQGERGRAEALCKEGLELSRRMRMAHHIAYGLHTSAALAGSRGQPVRSARLWGAAEALREAIGTDLSPSELQTYGPYIAAARAQVEETAWEAAWQEGRGMSREEAVEHALSDAEPVPARIPAPEEVPDGEPSGNLTRREGEVAALVARGLTNRQIASELSISEHTVATHIARTMKKLELHSRAQITAWVTGQRMPSVDSD